MKWPRITRSAFEDARDAIEKMVLKNTVLGAGFADALSQAFDQIKVHPRQHARLETNRTDQEVRRVILSRFNYLIIYKMVRDDPLVVAVMHASQQPDYWRTRESEGD